MRSELTAARSRKRERGAPKHPPLVRLIRTRHRLVPVGPLPAAPTVVQRLDSARWSSREQRPSGRAPPRSQIYRASDGPPPFSGSKFVADPVGRWNRLRSDLHAGSIPPPGGSTAGGPIAPISRR